MGRSDLEEFPTIVNGKASEPLFIFRLGRELSLVGATFRVDDQLPGQERIICEVLSTNRTAAEEAIKRVMQEVL